MARPSAVLVTYHPDLSAFAVVFEALRAQVDAAIVVDNGSPESDAIRSIVESRGGRFLSLGENHGLATAQNHGIRQALEEGAGSVLLLDQDTRLAARTVDGLLACHAALVRDGARVGSVASAYRETHTGTIAPGWRARHLSIQRVVPEAGSQDPAEVDFSIASGSLLPAEALRAVGLMEDDLFIDLVDIEWGLRAGAGGYRNFVSPAAIMDHTLGAGRRRLAGRSLTMHPPPRNYYHVRNAVRLARRSSIPPAWRLFFARRALLFVAAYTLVGDERLRRLRLMLKGLRDGIRDRGGMLGE